jgi:hypothetical protein
LRRHGGLLSQATESDVLAAFFLAKAKTESHERRIHTKGFFSLLQHVAPKPESFLSLFAPWLIWHVSEGFWALWPREALPFFGFYENFYHRCLLCVEEMERMSPILHPDLRGLAFVMICEFIRDAFEIWIYRAIDNELNCKEGHDAVSLAIVETAEALFNVTVSNFLLQANRSVTGFILLHHETTRLLLHVVAGSNIKLRIESARTKYQVEDICTKMLHYYHDGGMSTATLVLLGLTLPHGLVERGKSISEFSQ